MDPRLKKSWAAKFVAVGFIAMILFGNFWFLFALLGQPVPRALNSVIVVSAMWVLASGLWLFLTKIGLPAEEIEDGE